MSHANVLIVEDDHALARLYEKILKKCGYRTLLVETIEAAHTQFFRFSPDVVWLDWQLEQGTSRFLFDFIERLPPIHRPQVLVVSSEPDALDLLFYHYLIDATLTKPVTTQQATQMISELLDTRNPNHTPYGEVQRQVLFHEAVWFVTFRGYITAENVFEVAGQIAALRGVVIDLRDIAYNRVDLLDPLWNHIPLLDQLTAVVIIYSSETQELAHLAETIFGHSVALSYFEALDDGLAYAQTIFADVL
ncbi:MAG: response regulator [Anaerolineales bacterium]|nr:response regulator [Anaerolineales bacterium]